MKTPDIGLIVEGTYPYVSGGVSSWCHQLIQGLPEYTFHLIILLSRESDRREDRYELPANVTGRTHVFLYKKTPRPFFLPTRFHLGPLIEQFINYEKNRFDLFPKILKELKSQSRETILKEALYSEESLELLKKFYRELPVAHHSFLHFFWMMRSLFGPYFHVMTSEAPACHVFHSVSTGYAGVFGACLKVFYPDSRMLLTEHGIYTRERSMELAVAPWPDTDKEEHMPEKGGGYYKHLWTSSFGFMSALSYRYSSQIFALFEKNNEIQIREGADANRVGVIRNGIDLKRFDFKQRTLGSKVSVGFLGRIVPIKDIKTFLRACELVVRKHQNIEFELAGGTEEDPEYFEDCLDLVKRLNLSEFVQFPGKVDARAFLERTDVLVLTSLSEGQPLVLLEAMACGIPVIAPDVGGCREIIEGGSEMNYHPGGLITRQANPESTAFAIEKLITSPEFYKACSKAGRIIVEELYNEDQFLSAYRETYQHYLKEADPGGHRI